MRELHVVATSEDGRHVVLATRKGAASGDYRVVLDDRLAAAVRGDLPRPGEAKPAGVTPKEIQARLRAGESPEQVAASAGVPVVKIDRYAGPVLAERERVIAQARSGFVSRSRLGPSALPLGEAVDRHLSDTTGVRLETVTWSTRREDSGTWLVELSYVSQARRRSATWRYDPARREVTAIDTPSAQLAHVEPGRGARAVEPAAPRPAARAGSSGRRAAVRTAPAPAARTVAARPAPSVRAAAPVPRSTAPARTAAQEKAAAATTKAAHTKAAAEQAAKAEAARKAKAEAEKKAKAEAARKATAEAARKAKAEAARKANAEAAREAKAEAEQKAKAKAEAAPVGPPTLRVVGSDDAQVPPRRGPKEPPAAARTAPVRAAGQRASVPGWADVLLSTAPVARPADGDPDEG